MISSYHFWPRVNTWRIPRIVVVDPIDPIQVPPAELKFAPPNEAVPENVTARGQFGEAQGDYSTP
jgi:hypothetical protein